MLARIHASGRVWLSSAPIDGGVFLRVCLLSHRSTRARMEELVQIVRASI